MAEFLIVITRHDEFQIRNIESARSVFVECSHLEKVLALYSTWWLDLEKHPVNQNESIHQHAATIRLADGLRRHGLLEAADFAIQPWVAVGPISPGIWQFALLVGRSFASNFARALVDGSLHEPSFFNLDSFGAWAEFYAQLVVQLRLNTQAQAAATVRLQLLLYNIISNPNDYADALHRNGNYWNERAIAYAASPSPEEAWERPHDPPITMRGSYLWDALLEATTDAPLQLIAQMPHPAYIRSSIRGTLHGASVEQFARLIAAAPIAFDSTGRFVVQGALVLLLLDGAHKSICSITSDDQGYLITFPLGQTDQMQSAQVKLDESVSLIVDAILSRPDHDEISWMWLGHLIACGKARLRPRVGDAITKFQILNASLALICGLAARMSPRQDWKNWVRTASKNAQTSHALGALSVELLGSQKQASQLAPMFDEIIKSGLYGHPNVDSALAGDLDVVACLGGYVLAKLESEGRCFARMWPLMRSIRERIWKAHQNGTVIANTDQLLMLWGLCAYPHLSSENRDAYWRSLEIAVREMWQTDMFSRSKTLNLILVRLFSEFPPSDPSRDIPPHRLLGQALAPYATSTYAFLILVDSLVQRGWSISLIKEAVAWSGFDLRILVERFFAMRERLLSDRKDPEMDRLRKLLQILED